MNRITKHYRIHNPQKFKQQIVHWLNQFTVCCFYDNHSYQHGANQFELLAAAGIVKDTSAFTELALLDDWLNKIDDWIFGHLNFTLKDQLFQNTHSLYKPTIPFPDFYFFQPEIVCTLHQHTISIHTMHTNPDEILKQITAFTLPEDSETFPHVQFTPRISKKNYLNVIEHLLAHIHRGDCYEINFCTEWIAQAVKINPISTFTALSHISPAPFGAFYKLNNTYLLCASPERFLLKKGNQISSSPIKGTISRNIYNYESDETLKQTLLHSPKERSENVMIVDLVRNDLSRICKAGTVYVSELCKIYSYPQVHQLISTITGELKPNLLFIDILKAAFPMGSMTGAPKEKVLQLTEKYECFNRGLYAGSVGYFTPNKDFDFNVVIRSLQYNSEQQVLCYAVGSGITAGSNPEMEYQECLLKASAMSALFNVITDGHLTMPK